ncbi:MAG: hypothetical protein L0Z53_10420 [Acidobacteriales bacterium]|nr:hypothetical protein [Terriglobales bacterium]
MIAKLQEWLEGLFERRWFEALLIASVAYAAVWLYFLPRGVVFDLGAYLAVALWGSVYLVIIAALAIAIGRGIKLHFLPWDGRTERREKDRR